MARRAALFTVKLCRAMLEGLRNQLHADRKWSHDAIGVDTVYADLDGDVLKIKGAEETYVDDITGATPGPFPSTGGTAT